MLIRTFRDLDVNKESFALSMTIFDRSKAFPKGEFYSCADQVRRSSRSISASIAEAML